MVPLAHADAYEVLCLQAADEGRGPILFGKSLQRARELARPFMVGEAFPSVYLEFPLMGDPFLDVTVLYGDLPPGTRIASPAAANTERMLDWFARTCGTVKGVSFGFEIDTDKDPDTAAAIHFQPRSQTGLVRPFCEAIGEPERADLYLGLSERMPKDWGLSFFGLFRGRPGSPLRTCGYISRSEVAACGRDPRHLASVFDAVGFASYDDEMLAKVSTLMAASPVTADFQFDVHPDGTLSDVFAVDLQFGFESSRNVRASFERGLGARIMEALEGWGIADDRRWRLAAEASFTRAVPVVLEDGSMAPYALVLLPAWVKVRWRDGVPQPAKLYFSGSAGISRNRQEASGA